MCREVSRVGLISCRHGHCKCHFVFFSRFFRDSLRLARLVCLIFFHREFLTSHCLYPFRNHPLILTHPSLQLLVHSHPGSVRSIFGADPAGTSVHCDKLATSCLITYSCSKCKVTADAARLLFQVSCSLTLPLLRLVGMPVDRIFGVPVIASDVPIRFFQKISARHKFQSGICDTCITVMFFVLPRKIS